MNQWVQFADGGEERVLQSLADSAQECDQFGLHEMRAAEARAAFRAMRRADLIAVAAREAELQQRDRGASSCNDTSVHEAW
eukprot:SAG11_NODE_740_length_7421_cov_6.264818_6_plen_81_part_00